MLNDSTICKLGRLRVHLKKVLMVIKIIVRKLILDKKDVNRLAY